MRLSLFVAVSLCLSLFGFAAHAASAPEKPKAASPTPPAINVIAAFKAVITDRVQATGTVEPVEQVFVQPQIEGQAIESLQFDVGSKVKAGEVLAKLSVSALQLQKSQLEASRAQAEAAIAQVEAQQIEAQAAANEAARVRDRAKTLSGKGIASKSAADAANASSQGAEARLNAAAQAKKSAEAQLKVVDAQIADIDLKLARTEVRAPVGGTVVARNVMVGGIASAAGNPMFVLIRDGLLELRAEVAEQDVMRLAEGQKAKLHVAGLAEPLDGVVRMVEPIVSTTTRLGKVRIAIDNPEQLRWGVFVDADIVATSREAVLLPLSAVGISSGGATVLKFTGGRVTETKVVTGIAEGELIEIVSGLAPGDLVVAKAGAFVRNGDRITPVMIEQPATISN